MRPGELARLCKSLLGNPFSGDPDLPTSRNLIESLAVPDELSRLVANNDVDLAKDLILAVGHVTACVTANPAGVLDEHTLPAALAKKLPRPRSDYLRIVMAAGRCFQSLSGIRGSSTAMQNARADTWAACFGDSLRHALDLERVIRDHDILILGETGTGKEKFAGAIQSATPGDAGGNPAPSSAINAAAIPDALVESELFGHVRGAYTGATESRSGRLRSATGGSFFLDEVGDLPQTTQVKLLRVIETNEVFPVGSDTSHAVDVRYIAATHKDLGGMVDAREFRRDLYERLAGNILRIPALRDRPEDIVEIGRAFIRGYLRRGAGIKPSAGLEEWLVSREASTYAWPGNVRELQNVLRNLLLGLPSHIDTRHIAPTATDPISSDAGGLPRVPDEISRGEASFQDVTDWYIQRVIDSRGGNLTQASRVLGLDRSTVRRRLKSTEGS